jgi:hypothetical protein
MLKPQCVEANSVIKFISIIVVNLVTPKGATKLELLLNKLAFI